MTDNLHIERFTVSFDLTMTFYVYKNTRNQLYYASVFFAGVHVYESKQGAVNPPRAVLCAQCEMQELNQ